MKVLLCEDIKKLGWLGDVVEVKDGYARNYLLPHGLAQVPTDANLKALAQEKEKRAKVRLEEQKKMEVACAAVEGAEAVIAAKANELGHLFGSVTAGQIAQNLREQGLSVADENVVLADHIKEVGTVEATVKYAQDLSAKIKVTVVAEQDEASESADETENE